MAHDPPRTELDDLEQDLDLPSACFTFLRDAGILARERLHALDTDRTSLPLAPDELYHPEVPSDVLVRRGKLRISEFLDDGREVTRAVLQAGAVFQTRPWDSSFATSPAEAGQQYELADIVIVSLGEAELWILPATALESETRS